MKPPPYLMKLLLNLYRPLRGAGIRTVSISPDWKEIRVSMKLRWYNKNIVGTHFGGSLYAMTDPFWMLMLMNLLGKDYIVWDKSACIDFLRPGRGKVSAAFTITDEQLQAIRTETRKNGIFLPEFTTSIRDDNEKTIAVIKKIIYVRHQSSSL